MFLIWNIAKNVKFGDMGVAFEHFTISEFHRKRRLTYCSTETPSDVFFGTRKLECVRSSYVWSGFAATFKVSIRAFDFLTIVESGIRAENLFLYCVHRQKVWMDLRKICVSHTGRKLEVYECFSYWVIDSMISNPWIIFSRKAYLQKKIGCKKFLTT